MLLSVACVAILVLSHAVPAQRLAILMENPFCDWSCGGLHVDAALRRVASAIELLPASLPVSIELHSLQRHKVEKVNIDLGFPGRVPSQAHLEQYVHSRALQTNNTCDCLTRGVSTVNLLRGISSLLSTLGDGESVHLLVLLDSVNRGGRKKAKPDNEDEIKRLIAEVVAVSQRSALSVTVTSLGDVAREWIGLSSFTVVCDVLVLYTLLPPPWR
jgi:hypothetical protein